MEEKQTTTESTALDTTPERPSGISTLAILYFFSGIITIFIAVVFGNNLISLLEIFAGILFLVIGIALFQNKKWAWWAITIISVFNIFLVGWSIFDPEIFSERSIVYFMINGFLIVYFFQDNVLEYFGLENIPKKKAISIFKGIWAALIILSFLIPLLK